MIKEAVLSLTPFAMPASCCNAGCSCEWLCSIAGAPVCLAATTLISAALFAVFAIVSALRGLGALSD